MSNPIEQSGIDMTKDLPAYLVMFFSWVGDLNWLFIASIAVAAFRGWVAYKEYKLKERQANANVKGSEKAEKREDEERR